jgi:hypothetical protein
LRFIRRGRRGNGRCITPAAPRRRSPAGCRDRHMLPLASGSAS